MLSKRVRIKKKHKVRNILLVIFLFIVSCGLFLLYGPWHGFRDFWITTAMTTMNHQYLATWLYSDKTINYVLENNRVVEADEQIDTDLIEIYDDKITSNVY